MRRGDTDLCVKEVDPSWSLVQTPLRKTRELVMDVPGHPRGPSTLFSSSDFFVSFQRLLIYNNVGVGCFHPVWT